jgi:hypothetical protein
MVMRRRACSDDEGTLSCRRGESRDGGRAGVAATARCGRTRGPWAKLGGGRVVSGRVQRVRSVVCGRGGFINSVQGWLGTGPGRCWERAARWRQLRGSQRAGIERQRLPQFREQLGKLMDTRGALQGGT